jgi:hypothetical protein
MTTTFRRTPEQIHGAHSAKPPFFSSRDLPTDRRRKQDQLNATALAEALMDRAQRSSASRRETDEVSMLRNTCIAKCQIIFHRTATRVRVY